MSLLFIDSFDHYNSSADMALKWDVANILDFQTGRTGNAVRWYATRYCYLNIDNKQTLIVGFAFKPVATPLQVGDICRFYESSTEQLALGLNVDGSIYLDRGATNLATSSAGLVTTTVWSYFELKVTIDNSSGAYEFRQNENTIFSDSSVDTQESANAYVDSFRFLGGNYTERWIDDLYICDDSGSTNNDFLGDVKVEVIRPTGAGNQTDFTPSTGSNWENVDDTYPDEDTTYNYHAPQGLPGTDLFQMADLTTISGSIFGIQPIIFTRKDDAGSADLYSVIRTNSTDYVGSGISLGDSYVYHTDILEENPNTATAWTVTDINNIEGGYRRTS